MKRDMELVRDLLMAIEDGLQTISASEGLPDKDYSGDDLERHYLMMRDHGLIKEEMALLDGTYYIHGLTWEGHDFVDTLRDPAIWKKTKAAATTVGGVGFKAMVEIGKAIAKQELQKLGIPIP